ncbi:PREDICTED: uncharacterized protein At3g50808 isoform X2 [Tarenaya hassleriana]|uniref:uncharacterized protein At3g50808 isoform X2 n=1 Tax=Tarenaya hassleriana TaxID=28532 RepID=UPI00053C88AD|nr:PREDICTED: uncharacterized protein At3g50808 isoform X2 [Tarenaya hassleriana]
MEREMQVPPWLEPLLRTNFFKICSTHRETPRNECNMFCLSCQNAAFCFFCRSSLHKDHPVIQIRRSSYHDVVRVSEIENVLDIRGVQTYVINSARVIFLNERPQPKHSHGAVKSVSYFCEICSRSLLDPFRFCSLGCKNKEEEEGRLSRGRQQERHKGTHPPTHQSNSRRRKGIPRRAPFAS